MYTTQDFNNDVQKLRDLMDKCEALEKKKVIKLGTNVRSKIHDDLEGSVVMLDRSSNYAVVKTHISDYEIMTVEAYLSDLEAM
jgi:uncharacterized FlaG/YvyC family protein|tara:strand:+ start:104 stop:352 length:249 start_codon:yes stop_codon:yes gene_type:complete